MGLSIDKADFSPAEFDTFAARLGECLDTLRGLLARPGFGAGPTTIGAELELALIDAAGDPLPLNREVFRAAQDEHLQLELDRFNLEYNLDPVPLAGDPFAALARQLTAGLARLDAVAAASGGRTAHIGILPTLTEADLQASAMTDLPRYRALANSLHRLRGSDFEIEINGRESLRTHCPAVTLEGANTSFQVHLRVAPDDFARTFNAAQLATPVVLAIAANSPVFLGHLLWDETRIALFKQAIDPRTPNRAEWRRAARVPFGHGWLRGSPLELFAESVALFPPLIPVADEEHPAEAVAAGRTPGLWELRLHQGTVWQWNRAIYDPAGGGHLRIELRALPAGPSIADMVANTAFLLGLTLGLSEQMDELLPAFPFHYAQYNFYRAAQLGLDARLLWPARAYPSPVEMDAASLVALCLPLAADGLARAGVDAGSASRCLDLIGRRLKSRQTGARWQRQRVQALDGLHGRDQALRHMLAAYLEHMSDNQPVGDWPA
jgi:gamma-glutamyl:cysteine ligase YbdK (ATP-grasp superfamily)